jgi:WhiB family transcriptional regulator, redox-sensing transcriptional regulator
MGCTTRPGRWGASTGPGTDRPRGGLLRSSSERQHGARFGGPTALELVDVSEGWELHARCRGEEDTLFFGPNRFEPKRERLAREQAAKAVCAGCPVVDACREHALRYGEMYGVWGGLGETDRRMLLERRGGSVATAV